MKKHFTGIALFIFIIGISGFVASLFVQIPKPEIFEITETVPRYESHSRCSKKYRNYDRSNVSVKINRAVYDEKTGQLFAEYSIKGESSSLRLVPVNLHFFTKTLNKTQYLMTKETDLTPVFGGASNQDGSLDLPLQLLKDLDSYENLYIIAEPTMVNENGSASGGVRNSPDFDVNVATAILISKE